MRGGQGGTATPDDGTEGEGSMSTREFDRANDASRDRLAQLVASLDSADLTADVGGGWTVGTAFAHLAFWDGFAESRWRAALDADMVMPPDLPDTLTDIINGALAAVLAVVPDRAAAEASCASAESVDRLIRSLPDASVEAASDPDHMRLVGRWLHRADHIEQIERALGRPGRP